MQDSVKTKILIADDHPLICLALRSLFKEHDDFEILGEAHDGEETLRMALELIPDIIILDITMPILNGLEVTRQIKSKEPSIMVLVLTVHNDSEHIFRIFEAGADGYLTKTVLGEEVVNSVRGLISGEAVLSRDIFGKVLKQALIYSTKTSSTNGFRLISTRERELLYLAAKGMSNKEIAQQLKLSISTVKSYFVNLLSKLHAHNRTEAVIFALRSGLINLDITS